MSAVVIVYSSAVCPYCVRAKELLQSKGVKFQEIRVDADPKQKEIMLEKSHGQRTVPQIFINDQHVGGFDQLKTLNDSGKLDSMLGI